MQILYGGVPVTTVPLGAVVELRWTGKILQIFKTCIGGHRKHISHGYYSYEAKPTPTNRYWCD